MEQALRIQRIDAELVDQGHIDVIFAHVFLIRIEQLIGLCLFIDPLPVDAFNSLIGRQEVFAIVQIAPCNDAERRLDILAICIDAHGIARTLANAGFRNGPNALRKPLVAREPIDPRVIRIRKYVFELLIAQRNHGIPFSKGRDSSLTDEFNDVVAVIGEGLRFNQPLRIPVVHGLDKVLVAGIQEVGLDVALIIHESAIAVFRKRSHERLAPSFRRRHQAHRIAIADGIHLLKRAQYMLQFVDRLRLLQSALLQQIASEPYRIARSRIVEGEGHHSAIHGHRINGLLPHHAQCLLGFWNIGNVVRQIRQKALDVERRP